MNKTIAVKNKSIAMELINQGFEVLNVTRNHDENGGLCYIFEDTDKFHKAFKVLTESGNAKKSLLTDTETSIIVEILVHKQAELESYGINTDAIMKIIEKLNMKK